VVVDNKDKQQVPILQQQLLTTVGLIEECMVNGFPFEVPARPLPQTLATRLPHTQCRQPHVPSSHTVVLMDVIRGSCSTHDRRQYPSCGHPCGSELSRS